MPASSASSVPTIFHASDPARANTVTSNGEAEMAATGSAGTVLPTKMVTPIHCRYVYVVVHISCARYVCAQFHSLLARHQCFFNTDGDRGKAMGQSGAESCSETCASSLTFPSCKFCPEDVSGFDFGLESDTDEKCRFCPENDVLYPDKEFPLFGEGVECWMVQKFFASVDVNANARNW